MKRIIDELQEQLYLLSIRKKRLNLENSDEEHEAHRIELAERHIELAISKLEQI